MTSLIIGRGITSISKEAFSSCWKLGGIRIGENVMEIGSKAFADCSPGFNICCYAENVPDTEEDAFQNSKTRVRGLYVPTGSIEAYRTAKVWGDFERIEGIGDVNNDGKNTTADLVDIVNRISGKIWLDDYLADANGDGKVNIADVVKITGTIKKPNWVKVGTGTFWYDGLWFDYDEEGNEVPFVDPGYELFQQEGTNLYKITDWGGGVDYIFTWDKETNACATQMGYIGYTDPDYGEVSVVDVCTYWSDLSYEDWPSQYLPESNTFCFYNVYVVEAGYWGPYLEYFEVEWDADATPAPARTKTLKKRPHITNLTPKNK